MTDMIVSHTFSNIIANDYFDNDKIDNDKIINFCYQQSKVIKERTISNVGGYQSSNIELINLPEFQNIILEKSKIVAGILGIYENLELEISNSWININKKYDYNNPHNHPNSLISGVYYAAAEGDCGNIVFMNPNKIASYVIKNEYIDSYNCFNCNIQKIPAKTRNLLLFPSWLEHYVERNNTDKDRISIAFNVIIKENK